MVLAKRYQQIADPIAARRLVEGHLRLVVKIARECCSRQSPLQDLIQEGCLGLMKAVSKYDPDRGVKLSSYAGWWIRAYIYQHIMANARMLRVATTFAQRKLFFSLKRERERMEQAGQEADPKQIAVRLRVAEDEVIEMESRLNGRDVHYDTLVSVEGIQVPNGGSRPDEDVETREFQTVLRHKLDEVGENLGTREKLIFQERLLAEKPITLQELGRRCGISRERARQIEQRLKQRLRPHFEGMMGRETEVARAA